MKYLAAFAMPAGTCLSNWDLSFGAGTLTGTITDPENPEAVLPVENGSLSGSDFRFSAASAGALYEISGSLRGTGATFRFALHEEKLLEPGRKLSGNPDEVTGEYYVGFHSAGGPRYNNVVLEEQPDHTVTGEMFGLVTEETLREMEEMKKHMPAGGPPGGPGGPGGGPGGPGDPGGGPGGPRPEPKIGDRQDLNVFTDGTAEGRTFHVHTETSMNSVFDLYGTVEGMSVIIRQGIISYFEGTAIALP